MDDYLSYLKESLPEDYAHYPLSLLKEFADHARMLRERIHWCTALSGEAFRHYVLCPRVNDEDLSSHRPLFYKLLRDRVKGLTQKAAALEVNRWCHEHASYQAQDDRTASPLTVFRCGSGRCGEESAFLVAALRSVGLAARQVYAPRWSHCDDNHAWVEVLCGSRWRFLGACEPEPILDRGWFNTAASRAMLIRSHTFGPTSDAALHGPALDSDGTRTYHNQTARYAHIKEYTFLVVRDGVPAPGARVSLELLNEARFLSIGDLTADADGAVRVSLGLGDLHLSARLDGCSAEGFCYGVQEDGLTLELVPAVASAPGWTSFDFCAPQDAPVNPAPLTNAEKVQRATLRAQGTTLREVRFASFYDENRAARHPGALDLLQQARGNFEEIFTFLDRDRDPLREALLRTLPPKDLRDATAEVLEHCLRRARPFAQQSPVFFPYLLCPRVGLEPPGLWSCGDPSTVITPADVVRNLRAQGIPARLRALDGAAEVWREGHFVSLTYEETGRVIFTKAPEARLIYRQHWSLSRLTDGGWQDLVLSDRDWEEDSLAVELPAGRYRVITSLRLPAGDQFAARHAFVLSPRDVLTRPLYLRTCCLEDLLTRRALPLVSGKPEHGRCALLFWLEEGAEPTEHSLNELSAVQSTLRALPVEITFFLRGEESCAQATLSALLAGWPELRLRFTDWAYQVETLSRFFGLDPDRPPLAVVCNGDGEAVYASNGYNVGAVELLTGIATHLCGS